ncbi:MAG TPA: bifunctional biotin--[acetyl-CoA-carboxylase] ligase/biotin operon repressor BirA [Gammaproteobacteria bacterium]|nr:bifunctional biotin--[acetyl-CoA-carboxylase] ligase/biotin operon repressor BirA [Gammaproteobacteria bacterium]
MTQNLKTLIQILSDGEFHSGERLGKRLLLTRSAIWKLIKQLADWDLEIESVTNKGYCIPDGLTLLETAKISGFIKKAQQNQVKQIELFDSLPSTNDYLLNLKSATAIPEVSKQNRACFAEKQTQGKSRRGRAWVSPFAKNIYLSLLWHFEKDPSELSGLSLAIAIATVETLQAFGITKNLGIKWPNDVLCKNHKLAGILIELSGEANDVCSAVIGVGLNVNMPNSALYDRNISQPWTDLQRVTDQKIDRNKLAGMLLNNLIATASLFQKQGLMAFFPQWQKLDLTFNKSVTIITNTTKLQGIGRGINEYGYFLLEIKPGVIKQFASGEVSLRLS